MHTFTFNGQIKYKAFSDGDLNEVGKKEPFEELYIY